MQRNEPVQAGGFEARERPGHDHAGLVWWAVRGSWTFGGGGLTDHLTLQPKHPWHLGPSPYSLRRPCGNEVAALRSRWTKAWTGRNERHTGTRRTGWQAGWLAGWLAVVDCASRQLSYQI